MDNLYRDFILEHYRNPHNKGFLEPHDLHFADSNPTCGDEMSMTIQLDDAKQAVADVAFDGRGCAISQASASMMTDMLKGRTAEDADKLMQGFLHLVKGEDAAGLAGEDRERLEVMAGVSAFPMRVKCATLAWHAMKAALDDRPAAKTE